MTGVQTCALPILGGFYSSNTGETEGGFVRNSIYDLETQLQIDDLNKNGFRGYVYRMSGGNKDIVNEFDSVITDAQRNPNLNAIDETVKEFNFHQDPDLRLSDVDMDKLDSSFKSMSDTFQTSKSVVSSWFNEDYYKNHGAIKNGEGQFQ